MTLPGGLEAVGHRVHERTKESRESAD